MAVYGNIENLDAVVLAEVEAGARHIDGFSPIVETTATTNGEHIKITDKEAIHEFDILNGTALSVDVDGDTLVLDSDTTTYQPQEIEDVSGHFTATTVEGALDELYGTCADIAEDVDNLQDDLDTEVAAIRPISLGGTGASDAETAVSNLGIADYVVATGTSNNWKFQKWASGRMTATRHVYWSGLTLTTVAGVGGYVNMSSLSLPSGLLDTPEIVGSSSQAAAYVVCGFSNITTTTFSMRISRLFSTSNLEETHFSLMLEGRWK